jgi:hypothetical protein
LYYILNYVKKIHFILYQRHYKINNKLTIIFSAKEQKETKAMRERNCYAGMTERQQTSIRKRQNTPEAHKQKKSRRKEKRCSMPRVYCNREPIMDARDGVAG